MFSAVSVMACTCLVDEASEVFERAKAVFIGKVAGTGGWINPYVDFTVEKSWKTVSVDEITLDIKGCDIMNFVKGETYLVYVYKYKGNLNTGSCTRTTILSKAESDLKFLETKNTIPVTKTYYTRNFKTGLITAAFVLTLLC